MALKIGDRIPDLLGYDQNGQEVKSKDYFGKKIALYFYPKDNTPGCTAQACSLRDGYQHLQTAGYVVIGVSMDNKESHQNFIEKYSLPFPLISDVDKQLIQEFGVSQEKNNFGKKYMGIVRTTFLIDEEGIIQNVIEGRGVDTKNHSDQILNYK